MEWKKKTRAFLRWWVTPRKPIDPNVRQPPRYSVYVIGTVGIVLLEFYYFLYQFPYDEIPDKPVFLVSLFVWSLPPIIVSWAYRNASTKRELNAVANMMIVIGVLAITLGGLVTRINSFVAIVAAGIPGLLAGGIIGGDSVLIWYLRKKRSG